MDNWPLVPFGSFDRNTSRLFDAPQKGCSHGLARSIDVRLLLDYPKTFGINTHEQLCSALSRKAYLDINHNAVTKLFAMRAVMKLRISPQPKSRSPMRHFVFAPLPEKPNVHEGKYVNYVGRAGASIDSYELYRWNDLAGAPVDTGPFLAAIKIETGVVHG